MTQQQLDSMTQPEIDGAYAVAMNAVTFPAQWLIDRQHASPGHGLALKARFIASGMNDAELAKAARDETRPRLIRAAARHMMEHPDDAVLFDVINLEHSA